MTQMRTFLAVAEAGSVRAAADRLVVTASAVSAALSALQDSLRVELVCREGRGLRLTAAGEVYAGYAQRVLGLLDEARLAAAGEADPERGTVRLAAVTSAGEHVLPALLAGFRDRHPEAGVLLEVDNQQRVHTLFARNEVDLAIGSRPEDLGVVVGVRPNELIVVAPAKLLAESGVSPTVPWLGQQTWLLRERGSNTRASTQAVLAELGLTPRTMTVGSNGGVLKSVLLGLGVTLVSRDGVAAELASGELVEVPTGATPLRRPLFLAAHRGRSAATAALLVRCAWEIGTFQRVAPAS
nr:LysR substrate-binding domain-containing protein [Pseudonocardia acidicola]